MATSIGMSSGTLGLLVPALVAVVHRGAAVVAVPGPVGAAEGPPELSLQPVAATAASRQAAATRRTGGMAPPSRGSAGRIRITGRVAEEGGPAVLAAEPEGPAGMLGGEARLGDRHRHPAHRVGGRLGGRRRR